MSLPTFLERYNYLKLGDRVGEETFGFDRYLNQNFYRSKEWEIIRNKIIVRDGACDLAIPGRDLSYGIVVHHMNPMMIKDIYLGNPDIVNPEYLICVSAKTHRAIHYGSSADIFIELKNRYKNDTCPWRIGR